MLNPLVFHQAGKQLKFKPSVDLFASSAHHQLLRYYSKTPDPKAAGIDAFSLCKPPLAPHSGGFEKNPQGPCSGYGGHSCVDLGSLVPGMAKVM